MLSSYFIEKKRNTKHLIWTSLVSVCLWVCQLLIYLGKILKWIKINIDSLNYTYLQQLKLTYIKAAFHTKEELEPRTIVCFFCILNCYVERPSSSFPRACSPPYAAATTKWWLIWPAISNWSFPNSSQLVDDYTKPGKCESLSNCLWNFWEGVVPVLARLSYRTNFSVECLRILPATPLLLVRHRFCSGAGGSFWLVTYHNGRRLNTKKIQRWGRKKKEN